MSQFPEWIKANWVLGRKEFFVCFMIGKKELR